MKIVIFDTDFHYIAGSSSHVDDFCTALHKSKKCLDICLQSDLNALHQVKQTRKPFIYTCPFGLFEAIVPVLAKNEILAYLFIGPAIKKGIIDHSTPLKVAVGITNEFQTDNCKKLISALPHYTDPELDAYCQTLKIFARYLEEHYLLPANRQTIGQMVKTYIRNNLQKKITLAEISMNLHCSTVTLTENFRKEFGYTIMQYVTKKRMDLAESLLINSSTSITEIAESCGFSDVEYFSKCFKTYHGISPSFWRQKHTEIADHNHQL